MRRLAWLLLVFSSACVDLPLEYQIEDLRILEIRAEPPEIRMFVDAPLDATPEELLTSGFDETEVRMSVLAAHPDLDATFSHSWIRCEREGGGGFRRVPCDGDLKSRIVDVDSSSIAFSPVTSIIADFAEAEDPVAAIGALASDPRDLFAGLRINVNANVKEVAANVDVDTTELDGRKRIVLFDPAVVALVLREARNLGPMLPTMVQGVDLPSLCTDVGDGQLATLLGFLSTREPNRAPDYVELEYLVPTSTSAQRWTPGDTPLVLELEAGDSIRLTGRARQDDIELYRVIDDNCELLELDETLAWSWFVTDGTLTTHITTQGLDDEDLRGRRTIYTAPTDFEGSEKRVRIFSVLRDGRGGSDSLSFEVLVRR